MNTNVAVAEDLTPRKAPEIPIENVIMNSSGMVWRDFLVRLPRDFIADDLKEPAIWARVQRAHTSLVRHDRLYIVAWDESWIAEAIVTDSGKDFAVISKPRLTHIPSRYTKLLETEEYRVTWSGSGYCVERKRDGHRMSAVVSSAALAERDLQALYPRKL